MLRSTDIAGGVWGRAAHLLLTILVFGGLALGPVAHAQVAVDGTVADWTPDGRQQGHDSKPDAHHDCPVCLTLASIAAPELPVIPGSLLSSALLAAAPEAALHDRDRAGPKRVRAPPIS
jgi:hypothetical protein